MKPPFKVSFSSSGLLKTQTVIAKSTHRMFELRRIMLNSDFTLILPRIFGLSSANGKGAALLCNRHKRASVQLEVVLLTKC